MNATLYLNNPSLWNVDTPNLYRCRVKLLDNIDCIDKWEDSFGIRILTLDKYNGLSIQGETIKLYGGCIHHDNGVIGAATIERAEERRVQLLKEAGYNAIRSAHHPMSKALLKACDKHGMLVMDELSDMWYVPKSKDDFANHFKDYWETMIQAMVDKDYNHPSVIMYSIGNEIIEAGSNSGAALARKLSNRIRSLDDSRYITCGINGMISNMDKLEEWIKINDSDQVVNMSQNTMEKNLIQRRGVGLMLSHLGFV